MLLDRSNYSIKYLHFCYGLYEMADPIIFIFDVTYFFLKISQ